VNPGVGRTKEPAKDTRLACAERRQRAPSVLLNPLESHSFAKRVEKFMPETAQNPLPARGY
jgi:hypothetical protein